MSENPSPSQQSDAKNPQVIKALVVEWLLALRGEYLASGANAVTHWEHLQTRPLAAARTCGTLDEWITTTRRKLQLTAPSKDSSRCSVALVTEAREQGWRDTDVLRLVERRIALIVAEARAEAEERKARRESGE